MLGVAENDDAKQVLASTRKIVELFDELSFDDADDIEHISRTFKRFNSSMIKIIDEIGSELDDDDIDVDEIDIEDYYSRTQKAIKTAKKKLNDLINYLNGEIESAYED